MKTFSHFLTLMLGFIGLSAIAAGQTANLALGSGTAPAGASITLPLTLVSGGTQPAALQWSFGFSSDITGVTVTLGGTAVTAQKTLSCSGNNCLISGMNSTVIADGTVATATFQLAANPSGQSIPVQITGVVAATGAGSGISSSGAAGTVSLSAAPALSTLSCTPATVSAPGSTSCTVYLTSAAPAGGFAVPLSSNSANLTIPSSVNIAAGRSSATFTATASSVTADQSVSITASAGSVTKSATLSLSAAVQLVGLACSTGSSTSGSCTASLNKTAASAAALSISSSNSLITVPSGITIAAGQSGVTFAATEGSGSGTQTATITASLSGVSRTATVSLGGPGPSADSVSPNAASGLSQTFTFVFSDSQNVANLSATAVLFAPSVTYSNACLFIYDRSRGTIQLEWDSAYGADEKPLGSALVLRNSQCSIGATSVTTSGLSSTLTVAVTFNAAFSGLKNIYMYAADTGGAINTGWVQNGTYTVTSGGPVPSVDSVSPNAGSGLSQTFTFVISDSQSAANLSAAAVLFAPSLGYSNACLVIFDHNKGTIQLAWDSAAGSDSKYLTSSTTLQNSQCSIGATSVVTSTLSNTLSIAITFKTAFAGLKNIYMYAADNPGTINTGWVQKGTYAVVTGTPVPSADSVSPNAGTGPSQTFTFAFSDSQNSANVSAVAVLFAGSLSYPNSCFFIYDRTQGTIQLESDSVTSAAVKAIGSTQTLRNSQCSIGATSATSTPLSGTLSVAITFNPAFSGQKNIYVYAAETGGVVNTGWVQKGTWTGF